MPPRRRLTAEARRALLLDAAEAELAERGFAAMRLEDVATRAGVAKAVVYDHVPSKSALACEVLDRAIEDLFSQVGAAVAAASSGDPLDVLGAGVRAFFDVVATRPAARRLLFPDPGADGALLARYAAHEQQADSGIAALLAPYLPDVTDLARELLAVQVKTALNGLAGWWWHHPDAPRALLEQSALDLLGGGLLAVSRAGG